MFPKILEEFMNELYMIIRPSLMGSELELRLSQNLTNLPKFH